MHRGRAAVLEKGPSQMHRGRDVFLKKDLLRCTADALVRRLRCAQPDARLRRAPPGASATELPYAWGWWGQALSDWPREGLAHGFDDAHAQGVDAVLWLAIVRRHAGCVSHSHNHQPHSPLPPRTRIALSSLLPVPHSPPRSPRCAERSAPFRLLRRTVSWRPLAPPPIRLNDSPATALVRFGAHARFQRQPA